MPKLKERPGREAVACSSEMHTQQLPAENKKFRQDEGRKSDTKPSKKKKDRDANH
jgi:hypothetical protein